MKLLNADDVSTLLRDCLPSSWSKGEAVVWMPKSDESHPPEDWLNTLWSYLNSYKVTDLSQFDGLPLIPSSNVIPTEMIPLLTTSGMIMRSFNGLHLDKVTEEVVVKIGACVIDELSSSIKHHPIVSQLYVMDPSYVGVIKALYNIGTSVGMSTICKTVHEKLNVEEKRALRHFLSSISLSNLQPEHVDLVKKLPLLETYHGDKHSFVSVDEVSLAAPNEVLPVKISKVLVLTNSIDASNFAALFGVRQLSVIELLRTVVFPDVESAYYEPEEVESLMLYVIHHYYSFIEIDTTFLDTLKNLAFLPKKDLFVTADRFFDPDYEILSRLFLDEPNFPTDAYYEPSVRAILRKLGLRGLNDVDPEDLAETAFRIQQHAESLNSDDGDKTKLTQIIVTKSQAMLQYLSSHTDMLSMACTGGGTLTEELNEMSWVLIAQQKPPFYPSELAWFTSDNIVARPMDVKAYEFSGVIGSCMPTVDLIVDPLVSDAFRWKQAPSINYVVTHLKAIVKSYYAGQKAKYMELTIGVYKQLELLVTDCVDDIMKSELLNFAWIWHGEGFTTLNSVVFNEPFTDLSPFIYSLPTELSQFEDLFKCFGVQKQCSLPEVLKMVCQKFQQDKEFDKYEISHDLHLCVSVLNELKCHLQHYDMDTLQKELLIPIHDAKEALTIEMAPLCSTTYCDQQWLREGHDLSDLADGEDKLLFVHPNIPNSTAEALGVPTLMSRMLDAEEIDFSFGQSDSLTHRLHMLLKEYTDGFAIPKELIQNADDAGATTVKILYDERANNDARTCLIDDGMLDCQGPALWAYNDAVFTDEDFENITKLSGATKESHAETIGQFGLGFNAVYNLTDVPSFISRHSIVIFDPQTKHLGKSIKNKSKPGIKIDMRKHKRKLRRLGNQFKPFNDIFGCDLRPSSVQESYNGTLFRFPLRTKQQAITSEICQRHYDKREVLSLLNMFVRGAENVLLFTQNVSTVELFHIPPTARSALDIRQVFHVSKRLVQVIRELNIDVHQLSPCVQSASQEKQEIAKQSNFLRAASNTLKMVKLSKVGLGSYPKSSTVIDVERNLSKHGAELLSNKSRAEEKNLFSNWLVVSTFSQGEALKMSEQENNLVPSAGVALPLKCVDGTGLTMYTPSPILTDETPPKHNGLIFSYLPLPIHNGLPVHINGSFAVTSSRRHLYESNEDDKYDLRATWNRMLMKDAVCDAYITMLKDVNKITRPNLSPFASLWPQPQSIDENSTLMLQKFYEAASKTDDQQDLYSDGNEMFPLDKAVFIVQELRSSTIGDAIIDVFKSCISNNSLEIRVVDLPLFTRTGFESSDSNHIIHEKSYSLLRFLKEILLPNILSICVEMRDKIILYALALDNADIDQLLASNSCIPVSPSGEQLKRPSELVHPNSQMAAMFTNQDGRFPYGSSSFASHKSLVSLVRLGMCDSYLTWDDIIERAESVSKVNYDIAVKRSQALLYHLNRKVESSQEENILEHQDLLISIEFLPVLHRQRVALLPWKGSEIGAETLMCAEDLYLLQDGYLIGAVKPIVDEIVLPKHAEHVKQFLGWSEKEVLLDTVIEQLQVLIQTEIGPLDRELLEEMQRCCGVIYKYLQDKCEFGVANDLPNQNRDLIVGQLQNSPCIFTNGQFLPPSQIALNFTQLCAPYLYSLSNQMKQSFEKLFRLLGVCDNFGMEEYVRALQSMHDVHNGNGLEVGDLSLSLRLANLLNESVQTSGTTLDEVTSKYGIIYIPDAQSVLRAASELCFNEPECQWLPGNDGSMFSHPLIPYTISKQLGVNTRRQEMLKKHSKGIAFGQREKLTNRIKRILSSYPCDKEILKELLQNADDSGATTLHFVNDPRQHRAERVFDDSWRPLQGPALCVYNDSPFTESDLRGIQNLGEGSKGMDPNKTGQYGVGFNCVYHLTDAPSFYTCGSEIGESLCIFDPHGKFVPGASMEEPGRRYDNVTELKNVFKDVFPCYLPDKFDMQDATMFRFPLRTQRMAKTSELSDRPVHPEDVEELLSKFRAEIFDCLLFVNNVKTISVSSIDRLTHRLSNTYSVTVEMTAEDQTERRTFHEHIRLISSAISNKEVQVWEVEKHQVQYVLTLRDNKNYWEQWLVVQQLGFDQECTISNTLRTAIENEELSLMPRGGVAFLLSKSDTTQPLRPSRAFCFLPLPVKTNLPVQVNGHFALDHEARRNLWQEEEGYRSEWNQLLIDQVISQAYVQLLKIAPQFLEPSVPDRDSFCTDDQQLQLDKYSKLFPSELYMLDFYWKTLAHALCKTIEKQKECVLPTIRKKRVKMDETNPNSDELLESEVYWVSIDEKVSGSAYFDDLSRQVVDPEESNTGIQLHSRHYTRSTPKKKKCHEVLRSVLISCGFQLVRLPFEVYLLFEDAGVVVRCATPTAVLEYFKSECSCFPSLPTELFNTPIQTIPNLIAILDYCVQDQKQFIAHLDGLPLLLGEDLHLRKFCASSPVYMSLFYELLPTCAEMFVHHEITEKIFTNFQPEHHHVFQRFNVDQFASLLSNILPEDFYHGSHTHVPWIANSDEVPNGKWIQLVWQFISSELQRLTTNEEEDCLDTESEDMNEQDEDKVLQKILEPISEWCLIPAHILHKWNHQPTKQSSGRPQLNLSDLNDTEDFLVPVGMAFTILDFTHTGIMSYSARDTLRKIGVPELSWRLMDSLVTPHSPIGKMSASITNLANSSMMSTRPQSDIGQTLSASLQDPLSVLKVLDFCSKTKPIGENLNKEDCNILLKYFNDCHEMWTDDANTSVTILRELPFFLTVHGDIIKLGSSTVYVLPTDIPTSDMHIWEKEAGIIFLRRNKGLNALHNALGCVALSTTDMYCKFIFDSFHLMTSQARITHLTFLKDVKLYQLNEEEHESLLAGLKRLPFLEDFTSILRTADSYYDPYHPVFKAMLADEPNCFPPPPFGEFKWLDFLRSVGMQHNVTQTMLVSFANKIAEEAKQSPTDATFHRARTLATHIFKRSDILLGGTLKQVAFIPFIPSVKISAVLQGICLQYETEMPGQVPYIPLAGAVPESFEYLVWSSAHLLPDWANPYKLGRTDFYISPDEPDTAQIDMDNEEQKIDDLRAKLAEALCIQKEPTTESVIGHIRNICRAFMSRKTDSGSGIDELKAFMIVDVMKMIYKYLQTNSIDTTTVHDQLHKVACVVVDNGFALVPPSQVVINLYDEEQIVPHLYKLPTELGEFKKVFVYLGATLHATVDQYSAVLKKIYKSTNGLRMHPNEIRLAFKAVRGLFNSLMKHPQDHVKTKVLYLPSNHGMLVKSSELVFNNDPTYTYRIQDFKKQFLVDLIECQVTAVNYQDLIQSLPRRLQPIMLTDLVKEQLEDTSKRAMVTSTITERLRYQIQSRAFSHGLSRLLRHEQYRSGQKIPADVVETIQERLRNIRVLGAAKVVTYLSVEGERIVGSDLESDCFVESDIINSIELWNIYVARSASLNEELLVSIADVVNGIIGGLLKNSVHYLQPILACAPHSITKVLDRLKIRPDHSVDFIQPTLPIPGSFVPIDDHHLLREDFDEFETGEYVGYELEDSEDKYAPTYIYAIVLEKISEGGDGNSLFCSKYEINVGDERNTVIAHATDLYKFHRITGFVSRPSSTTTDDAGYTFKAPKFAESRSVSMEDILDGPDELPPSPPENTGPHRSGMRARKGFKRHTRRKSNSEKSSSEEKEQGPQGPKTKKKIDMDNLNYDEFSYENYKKRHGFGTEEETFGYKEPTEADEPNEAEEPFSNFDAQEQFPNFSDYKRQQQQAGQHSQTAQQQQQEWTEPQDFHVDPREYDDTPNDQYGETFARQEEETSSTYTYTEEPDAHATDSGEDNQQKQSEGTSSAAGDNQEDGEAVFEEEEEEVLEMTLDELLNNISDCLEEGWKLPESQRKKVIKRLLLRWHPDKNIGEEKVATIVTQHIYAEMERLEQGLPRPAQYEEEMSGFAFDPRNPFAQSETFKQNFYHAYQKYYEEANEKAKRHREQRKKYQENFSREYSASDADYSNFDVPPSFTSTNPQPAQARRFFRQAQEDLRAADNDYDGKEPAYEWVCFKAHQVINPSY